MKSEKAGAVWGLGFRETRYCIYVDRFSRAGQHQNLGLHGRYSIAGCVHIILPSKSRALVDEM